LRFYNHRLSKDAIIPVSDRLVAQIRRQQQDFRERLLKPPSIPLPRISANPDGELPFLWNALNARLRRWLADCDVRDASGQWTPAANARPRLAGDDRALHDDQRTRRSGASGSALSSAATSKAS
jgi:hypothetical protein